MMSKTDKKVKMQQTLVATMLKAGKSLKSVKRMSIERTNKRKYPSLK